MNCVIDVPNTPAANASDSCSHGTHVAGIAAGNDGFGRVGVAPAASIVAVQIFSFDPQRNAKPTVFSVDLFRGLQAAADAMVQVPSPVTNTSPRNNFVLNMSIGGDVFNVPCSNHDSPAPSTQLPGHPTLGALMDGITQLQERGVPVIAAAGNDSSTTGLAFPACLPGVIKVGAMRNTLAGNQRTWYSNYPVLANFPNETYFVAPGGAGLIGLPGIESAWIAPGTPFHQSSGTSQAAPHVAGLYAMVMAGFRKLDLVFTVEAATAFIRANDGSVDVTVDVDGVLRTYRAVRLRNP
ncbi:MAG: S8 family serine peptidase [Rubrivivax sp.]|nr:S8 family serine peptidase [Rubrivivax sp.]